MDLPDFPRNYSSCRSLLTGASRFLFTLRSRWCWPFADQRCYGAGKRRGVVLRENDLWLQGPGRAPFSTRLVLFFRHLSDGLPLAARWLAMSMRFQLAYLRYRHKTNFTFLVDKMVIRKTRSDFFVPRVSLRDNSRISRRLDVDIRRLS